MKDNDSRETHQDLKREENLYHYKTAGIRERSGYVPWWLLVVTAGLIIWGLYYLWRYWSPTG